MKREFTRLEKITFGINLIMIIFASLTMFITSEFAWFKLAFPITLVQFVTYIYSITSLTGKLITFPNVFIGLCYIFNFGHLPIKFFGAEFGKNVLYPLWYVDFKIYKKAFLFTVIAMFFVFAGMYFSMLWRKQNNKRVSKAGKLFACADREAIKKIGYVCFAIGIIPNLFINITSIYLYFKGGYINTYALQLPDFVKIIAAFLDFAFFALIIGYSDDKKVSTVIFLAATAYKGLTMISGGRGEAITVIIGMFIIWENLVGKLPLKKIIMIALIGYAVLIVINFIATARNIVNISPAKLWKAFVYCISNNQITLALSEFGSTFATTCFTIRSHLGPVFGLNYILPIVCVFPNIGGFNSRIVELMIFTGSIYTFRQPIGGSFIAEMFYSFSWAGCIIAVVFGILLGNVSYNITASEEKKNYFEYLIYGYTIPSLLFWIRGYFGALYRILIWHIGFAVLMLYFMKKRQCRGENR